MKRTLAVTLAIFILASCALAQTSGAAPAGKADAAKPATPAAASQPGSNLPSEATVNAFFHRMFGFEPNLVFKVISIKASPIDGLAEVTAVVNTPNGQQMTKIVRREGPCNRGRVDAFRCRSICQGSGDSWTRRRSVPPRAQPRRPSRSWSSETSSVPPASRHSRPSRS